MKNKIEALTGSQNKRLNNTDSVHSSYTSPQTDVQNISVGGTTIPPEEDVIHSKEWVDDGSLL